MDTELAAWWRAVARHAMEREGGEAGQAVVHAGLAAAPYLLRLREWNTAGYLLEQTLHRDRTPGTAQAALPYLRRITGATSALSDTGMLAQVLARVDPTEAERLLRDVVDRAVAAGEFWTASAAGGDLVNLLLDTGRLREALAVLDRKAAHARQAGLGPWTQLLDRSSRLQILYRLGESERVLAEVAAVGGHHWPAAVVVVEVEPGEDGLVEVRRARLLARW